MGKWDLGIPLLEPGTLKGRVGVAVTTPEPFANLGPERQR